MQRETHVPCLSRTKEILTLFLHHACELNNAKRQKGPAENKSLQLYSVRFVNDSSFGERTRGPH